MMILGKSVDSGITDNSFAITEKFSSFTEVFGKVVILSALFLAGLSIYGIKHLEVENRFIDYFRSDTEIYMGMETIDTALGGTTPLDIIIQAPEPIELSDQEIEETLPRGDINDDEFEDD
jgi:predicted RND superfamily exporter protein